VAAGWARKWCFRREITSRLSRSRTLWSTGPPALVGQAEDPVIRLLRATSSPLLPLSWQKGELRTLLIVLAICCGVALWTGLPNLPAVRNNLITANAVGLSIWSIANLVRLLFNVRLPAWGLVIAVPAGNVLG